MRKKYKTKVKLKKSEEINPYPKYSFHSGICYDDGRPCYGIDTRWGMWEITHSKGLPKLNLMDEPIDYLNTKRHHCPTCGR